MRNPYTTYRLGGVRIVIPVDEVHAITQKPEFCFYVPGICYDFDWDTETRQWVHFSADKSQHRSSMPVDGAPGIDGLADILADKVADSMESEVPDAHLEQIRKEKFNARAAAYAHFTLREWKIIATSLIAIRQLACSYTVAGERVSDSEVDMILIKFPSAAL